MQKIKIYLKTLFRNLFHNHKFIADHEIENIEVPCECCEKFFDLEQVVYGVRCKTCFAFIPVYRTLSDSSQEKLTDFHLDKFGDQGDSEEGQRV